MRYPILFLCLASCAHAPNKCPDVTTEQARKPALEPNATPTVDVVKDEFVRHLNERNAGGIFELFGPTMRAAVPLDEVTKLVLGAHESKGRITSSKVLKAGLKSASYLLLAEKGDWLLSIDLDGGGKVAGIKLTEPPPPPPPVATNQIAIGLPFKGRWAVFWGGDTLEVNNHIEHKSQRRAADLVIIGENGKTFRTDGKSNADYYAYGKEVRAVADGTVITIIDGVPENTPGTLNPYFAIGNLIILQHGPLLFSAYAHLQPGSQRVKRGGKVKRGDTLGLCGNSGNTSEPHLHFQLQDGPLFESAWGVEAVFKNVKLVRAGGESAPEEYRFLKGDSVEER